MEHSLTAAYEQKAADGSKPAWSHNGLWAEAGGKGDYSQLICYNSGKEPLRYENHR